MKVLFVLTPVAQAADGTLGILDQQEGVYTDRNVIMRVTPVRGDGTNGGTVNQYAFPNVAELTEVLPNNKRYLKPEHGSFHKTNDLSGTIDQAEEPCSIRVVNSQTYISPGSPGIPTYRDLVFDLLGNTSEQLANLQHYELDINPELPAVWLTLPQGYSVGGGDNNGDA